MRTQEQPLDEFFQTQFRSWQQRGIEAACADMWQPYRLSMEQWASNCRIIYNKFHIMQHANGAGDEVWQGRPSAR